MFTLLKLNIRQFKDVFLFAFFIELLFLVGQKMGSDPRIEMCHAIWMMIMASFLVYYTVCNMVKFYNGNEDLFMHLSGMKREHVLFIKAGIAVHLIYVFFFMTTLYTRLGGSSNQLVAQLVLKYVSLITFYVLVCSLILLIKPIRQLKGGVLIFMLLLVCVTAGQLMVFFSLNPEFKANWMVGVTSYTDYFVQYLNLLPVMLLDQPVTEVLVFHTLISNGLVILLALLNIGFSMRYVKKNFI